MLHAKAGCKAPWTPLSTMLPSLFHALGLKAMGEGLGPTSIFPSYRESSSG